MLVKKESTVVSEGNLKIGKTPNVSLLPGATCAADVPCKSKCYCSRAMRCYPSAFKKWAANTRLWQTDPQEFERQILVYLEKKRPEYFRWAVAGDMPDINYLRMMLRVARRFPDTKFLAFTKQYNLLIEEQGDRVAWVPPNLTIIVSGWPGYRTKAFDRLEDIYPTSWVTFKGETSPLYTFPCPGKCEGCRKCWGLKAAEQVEFKEH